MTETPEQEIARLKQWVADLQCGCHVNCVYCGHRYGHVKEVPVSMADVLKEHVKCCPAHPMNEYREALESIAAQGKGGGNRAAVCITPTKLAAIAQQTLDNVARRT